MTHIKPLDTLDSCCDRGATTDQTITVGGVVIADAATIGSVSDTDAIAIAADGTVSISSRWLRVGVDDTLYGEISIYGHGTGSTGGGRLKLYCAADYDGSEEYWGFGTSEDDFFISNESATVVHYFRADGSVELGSLTTPTIADFTNATHDHSDAANGGASIVEESWTGVTHANSWVDFGGGGIQYNNGEYFKARNGLVYIRGLLKNGSAANATMFTLPAGYRPSKQEMQATISAAGVCNVNITAAGAVYAASGGSTTWTCLDGICFRAA